MVRSGPRCSQARLRSEGIDAQLQGALSGAYGFTVGDMARVDVYVPEDQLDDATYVLLADEVDATLTAPTDWWDAGTDRPPRRRPWMLWVAAAAPRRVSWAGALVARCATGERELRRLRGSRSARHP